MRRSPPECKSVPDHKRDCLTVKWFTEFGHLNRGDMLTSEDTNRSPSMLLTDLLHGNTQHHTVCKSSRSRATFFVSVTRPE
ncbi:hypothetical protein C7H11_08300 [Escherichia coli]|nr:hypothetical protein C7H11_08300 [Escherichia coli]